MSAIIAIITIFFITDNIRTKLYGQPPVFCVKTVTYSDGISAHYYGAGYKIKRDYNLTDGSEVYTVTLWLLPDSVSL